jgi:FMN-dependent NADH-azoreductase
MGITDITFIHVENDEYGGTKLAESIAAARAKITKLVAV